MRAISITLCLVLAMQHTTAAQELLLRIDDVRANFGPDPKPGGEPTSKHIEAVELLIEPDRDFSCRTIRGREVVEISGRCSLAKDGTPTLRLQYSRKSPTKEPPETLPDGTILENESSASQVIRAKLGQSQVFGGMTVHSDAIQKVNWFYTRRRKSTSSTVIVLSLDERDAALAEGDERIARIEQFRDRLLRWADENGAGDAEPDI